MIFALYQKVKHTDHIKHNNDEVAIPVFSDSITMYRSTHDICTYHNMYNLTKTSSSRRVFLEHTWSWLDHVAKKLEPLGWGIGTRQVLVNWRSFWISKVSSCCWNKKALFMTVHISMKISFELSVNKLNGDFTLGSNNCP